MNKRLHDSIFCGSRLTSSRDSNLESGIWQLLIHVHAQRMAPPRDHGGLVWSAMHTNHQTILFHFDNYHTSSVLTIKSRAKWITTYHFALHKKDFSPRALTPHKDENNSKITWLTVSWLRKRRRYYSWVVQHERYGYILPVGRRTL